MLSDTFSALYIFMNCIDGRNVAAIIYAWVTKQNKTKKKPDTLMVDAGVSRDQYRRRGYDINYLKWLLLCRKGARIQPISYAIVRV